MYMDSRVMEIYLNFVQFLGEFVITPYKYCGCLLELSGPVGRLRLPYITFGISAVCPITSVPRSMVMS